MSTEEFKVGDTVQLKSGGPTMTVNWVGLDDTSETVVHCKWFDKSEKLTTESFAPATLQKN